MTFWEELLFFHRFQLDSTFSLPMVTISFCVLSYAQFVNRLAQHDKGRKSLTGLTVFSFLFTVL